jgi:hypothetical protein
LLFAALRSGNTLIGMLHFFVLCGIAKARSRLGFLRLRRLLAGQEMAASIVPSASAPISHPSLQLIYR